MHFIDMFNLIKLKLSFERRVILFYFILFLRFDKLNKQAPLTMLCFIELGEIYIQNVHKVLEEF